LIPGPGFARHLLTYYARCGYLRQQHTYQRPLFSVQGLSLGPHTLSIEVTHTRDGNALGAWFYRCFRGIRRAGIPGGITGIARAHRTKSPAAIYTGSWFTNKYAMHSEGSAALSVDPGSSVTFSFNGQESAGSLIETNGPGSQGSYWMEPPKLDRHICISSRG